MVNIKLPARVNPVNATVETEAPSIPTTSSGSSKYALMMGWSSLPVVYLYLLVLCFVWILYILLNPSRRPVKHDVTDTLLVERSREQEATESNGMCCRRLHHKRQ